MNCRRCSVALDADQAGTLRHLDLAWWDLCPACAEAANAPTTNEANATPEAFSRHLAAAQGYLELELPLDAWNELEAIEPPWRRAEVAVLGVRVAIHHALQRWEPMGEVCRHLATVEPGEVCWTTWLATATRHHEGIPAAREILLRAMGRFPREAVISYHLACYAAQVGDLEDAKDCLRRAFRLDDKLRARALEDPDLAPLW